MRVSGLMTSKMVKGLKLGLMGAATKEATNRA